MMCPACGKAELAHQLSKSSFEYQGETFSYDQRSSKCSHCQNIFISQIDARLNARAAQRIKNNADGLLLGEEIKGFRQRFKLDQIQASKLFGGGPTAFAKYEVDEIAHNVSMDKLLRLCIANPVVLLSLAEDAKIELKAETVKSIIYQEMASPKMRLLRLQMMQEVLNQFQRVPKRTFGNARNSAVGPVQIQAQIAKHISMSNDSSVREWVSDISKNLQMVSYHG